MLSTWGCLGSRANQKPEPQYFDPQVFREDGLISPSPNFGLDWFEGAIPKPDQVLLDFYTAYHPTSTVRICAAGTSLQPGTARVSIPV